MSADDDGLEYRVPDAPRIGRAIRDSLVDFYFNSWRLVPANVIWGVALLGVIFLLTVFPLAALLLVILLALPTAGVYTLAVLIARGEPVGFGDALAAWRRFLRPALLAGVTLTFITLVLGTNVLLGFGSGEPLGWALGTAAGWGLVATWAVAIPLWPLLVDPVREPEPLLARVRLAAALVLISPAGFGALLLLVAVLIVISTILFAALVTISIAFVALVTARYTLAAADRLEGRATQPLPG